MVLLSGLPNLPTSANPQRKLRSWIDAYIEFTAHISSPEIWRKWAAYAAVAVATGRKVWLISEGKQIRTNIYVFLVGPPGTGKTAAIGPSRGLLLNTSGCHISPNILTKEKFIDLFKASKEDIILGPTDMFSHCTYGVLSSEVVVFLRPNDVEFINNVMDLYDNDDPVWEYATRMHGIEAIANPHLTILGGITPKSLSDTFGNIFGRGFVSRVLLIYANEKPDRIPFSVTEVPDNKDILADLASIKNLNGAFKLAPEALTFIRDWYKAGLAPLPNDPRFEEYLPRRFIHWIKISMLRCAARTNEMIISLSDVEIAKRDLLELETVSVHALEAIGKNPLSETITNAHKWAKIQMVLPQRKDANGKPRPITEAELRSHLMKDVPPQYLVSTIETMVTTNLLLTLGGTSAPNRLFYPSE